LSSVVIWDDTPGTQQRWRVLFFKNEGCLADSLIR